MALVALGLGGPRFCRSRSLQGILVVKSAKMAKLFKVENLGLYLDSIPGARAEARTWSGRALRVLPGSVGERMLWPHSGAGLSRLAPFRMANNMATVSLKVQ